MKKLPSPKEVYNKVILKKVCDIESSSWTKEDLFEAMKEYGRQVRDKTLEWAAENAQVVREIGSNTILEQDRMIVDYKDDGRYAIYYRTFPESILLGKIHKDLEI